MAENPKKKLYSLLWNNPDKSVSGPFKKYSYPQFEQKLNDPTAKEELVTFMLEKNLVADPVEFEVKYMEGPAKPARKPVSLAPPKQQDISSVTASQIAGTPVQVEKRPIAPNVPEPTLRQQMGEMFGIETEPAAKEEPAIISPTSADPSFFQKVQSYASDIGKSIERGWKQGEAIQQTKLTDLSTGNYQNLDFDAMAKANAELRAIGQTATEQDFQKSDGIWDDVTDWAKMALPVVAESFTALGRSGWDEAIAGGALAGLATAGRGTGTGIQAGLAVSSYQMELYSSIMDELEEKGIDTGNAQALKAAFQDKALMGEVLKKANTRAGVIAATDLMFGSGVGKVLKAFAPKTAVGKAIQKVGSKVLDSELVGGAGGEAAAQLITEGKINPQDLALEAIGETVNISEIKRAPRAAQKVVGTVQEIVGAMRNPKAVNTIDEVPVAAQESVVEVNTPEGKKLVYDDINITVTPEEFQAYQAGTIDPERQAGLADDVAKGVTPESVAESDPLYARMLAAEYAKQRAARDQRISEIESLLSSDNASREKTGTGNLIPEGRQELLIELQTLRQANDNQNQQGVSGEVREGQEPVQGQSLEGTSETPIGPSGDVQVNETEVAPGYDEEAALDLDAELAALEGLELPEESLPLPDETGQEVDASGGEPVATEPGGPENQGEVVQGVEQASSEIGLTKKSVTERLGINHPFYQKVSEALAKLGLIEKYNPETQTGDVLGGYVQKTSTGGFSSGKFVFNKNGDITYFDGGIEVKFDQDGNVISENIAEAKQEAAKVEIEGKKSAIESLKKNRDSEEFKYKTGIETNPFTGEKKTFKRLKTAEELKESTDKINAAISKAENELNDLQSSQAISELEGANPQPQGEVVRQFADRIRSGEQMSAPEDLQFYENNKKAIEDELKQPIVKQPAVPLTTGEGKEGELVENSELKDVSYMDVPAKQGGDQTKVKQIEGKIQSLPPDVQMQLYKQSVKEEHESSGRVELKENKKDESLQTPELKSMGIVPLNVNGLENVFRGSLNESVKYDSNQGVVDAIKTGTPEKGYHPYWKGTGGIGIGIGKEEQGNWPALGRFFGTSSSTAESYPMMTASDLDAGEKPFLHKFSLKRTPVIISKEDAKKISKYKFRTIEELNQTTQKFKDLGIDGVYDNHELFLFNPSDILKTEKTRGSARSIDKSVYIPANHIAETYAAAKRNGTNPELVKTIDSLFANAAPAVPLTTGEGKEGQSPIQSFDAAQSLKGEEGRNARKAWDVARYKAEIQKLQAENLDKNTPLINQLITELGELVMESLKGFQPPAQKRQKVKKQTDLEKAIFEYEEGSDTFGDLVNKVEGIAFETESKTLQDAVDAYRAAEQEDFKLSGRGDMDAAQSQFLEKIQSSPKKSIVSEFDSAQALKGEEGRNARKALKESMGKEQYKDLEAITNKFPQIAKDLESRGAWKIDCP
jgi:hypothetical protein